MPAATLRQLAKPFAMAMAHKAHALADLELTRRQAAALARSMGDDVRKFHDAAVPALMPFDVSEAAARAAEERGLDLAVLTYAAQPAVDTGRGTFHYEHMVTISSIVAKARATEDVEEIIDLLCTSRVAWITKAENDELTKRGYNSRHDVGWRRVSASILIAGQVAWGIWIVATTPVGIRFAFALVVPGAFAVWLAASNNEGSWARVGRVAGVLAAVGAGTFWFVLQLMVPIFNGESKAEDWLGALGLTVALWTIIAGVTSLAAWWRISNHRDRAEARRDEQDTARHTELLRAARHAGAGTRVLAVGLSAAALFVAVTGRGRRRT